MVFLPVEKHQRLRAEGIVERIIKEEGLSVLGWRDTPIQGSAIGRVARASQPYIEQVFVGRGAGMDPDQLERKLYVIRKRAEAEVAASEMPDRGMFSVPSLSGRTIVYKGLLLAPQIAKFYSELSDPDVTSALCLVHQRFSTNTFPTWQLAHPFHYVAHNGEINTVRGNVSWMHARQSVLESDLFGADLKKLFPVIQSGGSDSSSFDNALELLVQSGRSLPHAMAMLIPEAWDSNPHMDAARKAFYEYHCSLMEPWDGPAAIAFTDGRVIGATLDRNGLRPARYLITKDDMVVLSSETGVLPVNPEDVSKKGRLQPGKMFLVDLEQGRIVSDREIKNQLAGRQPYADWLAGHQITLDKLSEPPRVHGSDQATIMMRQRAFGYTDEDVRFLMTPMAINGEEPIGSMGIDTPLACLSDKPQPLFNYFKQLFAQVTNPPIDPIREEMVMSLVSYIGKERNILAETPRHCHTLKLLHPIIQNRDLEKLRRVSQGDFLATTLSALFPVAEGEKGLQRSLDGLCRRASLAIQNGYTILILSDRGINPDYAPIPSLLAMTAVHNHLVREGSRTQGGADHRIGRAARSHAFRALDRLWRERHQSLSRDRNAGGSVAARLSAGWNRLRKWAFCTSIRQVHQQRLAEGLLEDGHLHAAELSGGAQVFEAIGLNREVVDKYFTGTSSRIEGVGLDVIAREAAMKHASAYQPLTDLDTELPVGGSYAFRVRGEYHLLNPSTVSKLQHAVRQGSFETFQEYAELIDQQNEHLCTLRGLFKFKTGTPVPIEDVEPASEIVKRFATGAMSFGSISKEAHETLAIAMNRIGGKSNTGEGGEDEERVSSVDPNVDLRRIAIGQVASGRLA